MVGAEGSEEGRFVDVGDSMDDDIVMGAHLFDCLRGSSEWG